VTATPSHLDQARVPTSSRSLGGAGELLRRRSGLWASAGLVVTWSSGFVGAELGTRAGAAPLTVLGWRFALLTAALLVVCATTGTSLRSWQAWRRQTALGLLCQAGYLICVFEGVSRGVHGGTTALIAALQPLLVATVAGRLLGERSTRVMWIGMAVGLLGVLVVVSGDLRTHGASAWAFAYPLVGMLSLATGTVLTRRVRPAETILQSITMQSVVTAVVTMALAALTGQAAPPTDIHAWTAILWLLVLASVGGYGLYVFVTRTLGATTVSTLLYLTPPTTMLWVLLMFGEPVTGAGIAGLLISALGVYLVLHAKRGSTHKETTA
jgi:drug/metabolite transporter (DMT)-like permease